MGIKFNRSEGGNAGSTSFSILPFAIAFPLLCIAFGGCWEDGCQGALNAQSKAVHEAVQAGGWK